MKTKIEVEATFYEKPKYPKTPFIANNGENEYYIIGKDNCNRYYQLWLADGKIFTLPSTLDEHFSEMKHHTIVESTIKIKEIHI